MSEAQDHLAMHQRMRTLMCAACRRYERQSLRLDQVFTFRVRRGHPALPTRAGLDAAAHERIRNRFRQDG